MCSLAPRGALGSDAAAAFLDRRRGVAAVAPVARGVMAPSARTLKRARDGLDGKAGAREGFAAGEVPVPVVVPTPGQQRLRERMTAELEAVRDLHRKAVLLCRGVGGPGRTGAGAAPAAMGGAARFTAAGLRRKGPSEAAAKRSKTSPSKATTEVAVAAHQIKQQPVKQPHLPVQRAVAPPPPERLMASKIEKAKEAEKRRRMEEIARAREECRRQVLEVEMAAMPDEVIYPEDLEELGIAEFEYVVTRTRRQALS